MVWQLLGNQICHARKLYNEQIPPNLKQSNFDLVVLAAGKIIKEHPDVIPLISDLTSLIQLVDLLVNIPRKGMMLFEVKEGKENKRL